MLFALNEDQWVYRLTVCNFRGDVTIGNDLGGTDLKTATL